MDEPTYLTVIEAIIAIHGPDDAAFILYWSDVYDGRAWRAFPEFWRTLQARRPKGKVEEVVAAWSRQELRTLYDRLLDDPT